MRIVFLFSVLSSVMLFSCEDKQIMQHEPYQLIVKFRMDDQADRQDNLGNIAEIPAGNAAQSPDFQEMGIHFLGIYPDKFTPYDNGVTLLSSPTTEKGGIKAIDFENEFMFDEVNNSFQINLSDLEPGIYEYLRSSIAFQKYEIDFNLKGAQLPEGIDDDIDAKGLVASFLGYNTYIENYNLNQTLVEVQENKAQGYFGMEASATISGFDFKEIFETTAPQTTVPNPINDSSPVPAGSCVVTGKFPEALIIPDVPSKDIEIEVVISTNKSFEWIDSNGNGVYEPLLNEKVVDMGTRGFYPVVL